MCTDTAEGDCGFYSDGGLGCLFYEGTGGELPAVAFCSLFAGHGLHVLQFSQRPPHLNG